MASRLLHLVSPVLAAVLAGGLFAQMRSFVTPDDAEVIAYHDRVRETIEDLPARIGNWYGNNADVPDAAGKLLQPNKLFARRYLNPDYNSNSLEATNRSATLIIIHCRDSRDMSGHYPPNCYGGTGWIQAGPPTVRHHQLWGYTVPIAAYKFTRTEMGVPTNSLVFDFFVLPYGGFVTDMAEVQAASGDYQARPFGCAQVQVVIDLARAPETPQKELVEQREDILRQILEPIGPVIESLRLSRPGGSP